MGKRVCSVSNGLVKWVDEDYSNNLNATVIISTNSEHLSMVLMTLSVNCQMVSLCECDGKQIGDLIDVIDIEKWSR